MTIVVTFPNSIEQMLIEGLSVKVTVSIVPCLMSKIPEQALCKQTLLVSLKAVPTTIREVVMP